MRIIAGDARGRTLVAPKGMETRPTSDKIREALFSILMFRTPGAYVLDLFGGTGALALEAMSRGAAGAVICDISKDAIQAIKRNTEMVVGSAGTVEIIKADYRHALETVRLRKFDIVFLDPPYKELGAYGEAVAFLLNNDCLNEDAVIIAERQKDAVIALPDNAEVRDTRTYRDTCLDFIYRR